jgi:hypothetical protein
MCCSSLQSAAAAYRGITRQPDSAWIAQVARNATMQNSKYRNGCRYLLHDHDQKFCREFRETLAAGGVKYLPLPARSRSLSRRQVREARSVAKSGSAAYSNITAGPHEYFYQTGSAEPGQRNWFGAV